MNEEPPRSRTRRQLVTAARIAISDDGGVTPHTIADICEQVGIPPVAFRRIFATDQELLDAVHIVLVEECAERLRAAVDGFEPRDAGDPPGASGVFVAAAVALARSAPIDRTGLIIRSQRRLAALHSADGDAAVAAAERMFGVALVEIFADLFAKLGRRFSWPPALAVRVVLDTYERSFEAWLLRGESETHFPDSDYVARSLPEMLERMSAPAAG